MPFLLQAPTSGGMPTPPNKVGEEPKSQSAHCADEGTCQACRNASDPDRCTIDSEFPNWLPGGQVSPNAALHWLPVETHTSLPVDDATMLDQTLAPIDPAGRAYQVCNTLPVCWSSSTTPPRISGLSHSADRPT